MKERLKKIREELKKTQKEMSALLGVGDATWQNLERGISNPRSDILKKLDDMGFSMSWIMLGVGNMYKDEVAEEAEYGNFSRSLNGTSEVNPEKVFRGFLEEFQRIYDKQISKLPKNFVEIIAFKHTMEVVRMADDLVMAMNLMQKIADSEAMKAKNTHPNERYDEIAEDSNLY